MRTRKSWRPWLSVPRSSHVYVVTVCSGGSWTAAFSGGLEEPRTAGELTFGFRADASLINVCVSAIQPLSSSVLARTSVSEYDTLRNRGCIMDPASPSPYSGTPGPRDPGGTPPGG